MSLEMVDSEGSSPRGQTSPRQCFPYAVNCLSLLLVRPGAKSGFPMTGVIGEGSVDRSVLRKILFAIMSVVPIRGWTFKSSGGGVVSHGQQRDGGMLNFHHHPLFGVFIIVPIYYPREVYCPVVPKDVREADASLLFGPR